MTVDEPEIRQVVCPSGGLLDNVIDVGLSVVALHEQATQLAQPPVPGNHSQPRAAPRCRTVAAGGGRRAAVRLRAAGSERGDSSRHFPPTRT